MHNILYSLFNHDLRRTNDDHLIQFVAAHDWDSGVSGGAAAKVRKPACEDSHTSTEQTNTKLGCRTSSFERDKV